MSTAYCCNIQAAAAAADRIARLTVADNRVRRTKVVRMMTRNNDISAKPECVSGTHHSYVPTGIRHCRDCFIARFHVLDADALFEPNFDLGDFVPLCKLRQWNLTYH
jgi:hypothetical protein